MEERIIDDEYGRGIRMKKTENGYVDATDELAEKEKAIEGEEAQEQAAEELVDEVLFEFPEEDDEELAALSFEEAQLLKKRREEERKARESRAEAFCAEGESALEKGEFEAAWTAFDKAMDEIPAYERAAIGFWHAKTENGSNFRPLLDEWAKEGYAQFLVSYGEECVEAMKKEYSEIFAKEKALRDEEIAPLRARFEEKTQERREILKERTYTARKKCIPFLSLEVAFAVFAVVFGLNIFSRSDAVFVWLTIGCGAAFAITLPFFCKAAATFSHALSLSKANEKMSSTEEGRRLETLEAERDFLASFL